MTVIVEQKCTVEFRGRAFSAGGAVISPNEVIAYPHFPNGEHVGAMDGARLHMLSHGAAA